MLGITNSLLTRIVPRLAQVSGVVGVVLGGSRARDVANPASDYDIGLYYGPDDPLDTEGLLIVAKELVDDADAAAVTAVGGWGPRIVGGAWLTIEGCKVDLLYRGIDPVRAVISDCHAGRVSMNYQAGHPHGFCSAIWMGEIALCRPLHDPQGLIAELKTSTSPYPDRLREALLKEFLWEGQIQHRERRESDCARRPNPRGRMCIPGTKLRGSGVVRSQPPLLDQRKGGLVGSGRVHLHNTRAVESDYQHVGGNRQIRIRNRPFQSEDARRRTAGAGADHGLGTLFC
jgi:hypothetical protein